MFQSSPCDEADNLRLLARDLLDARSPGRSENPAAATRNPLVSFATASLGGHGLARPTDRGQPSRLSQEPGPTALFGRPLRTRRGRFGQERHPQEGHAHALRDGPGGHALTPTPPIAAVTSEASSGSAAQALERVGGGAPCFACSIDARRVAVCRLAPASATAPRAWKAALVKPQVAPLSTCGASLGRPSSILGAFQAALRLFRSL